MLHINPKFNVEYMQGPRLTNRFLGRTYDGDFFDSMLRGESDDLYDGDEYGSSQSIIDIFSRGIQAYLVNPSIANQMEDRRSPHQIKRHFRECGMLVKSCARGEHFALIGPSGVVAHPGTSFVKTPTGGMEELLEPKDLWYFEMAIVADSLGDQTNHKVMVFECVTDDPFNEVDMKVLGCATKAKKSDVMEMVEGCHNVQELYAI